MSLPVPFLCYVHFVLCMDFMMHIPELHVQEFGELVILKVWLKLNKFYITIAQVTEHKKTNKMVFVWRKSVKDIKNKSLSNISFLILSFKHRLKHGSGF